MPQSSKDHFSLLNFCLQNTVSYTNSGLAEKNIFYPYFVYSFSVVTASPEGFKLIEETIEVKAKKDGVDLADISTLVQLGNQKKIYDLALRKYITAVKEIGRAHV